MPPNHALQRTGLRPAAERDNVRQTATGSGDHMDFLLKSIEHASQSGCHLPAVVTALTVPDIAAAVDAGVTNRKHYAEWVDKWFAPAFPTYAKHEIDGLALYSLRCKLLHEGLSSPFQAPAAQGSAAAAHKKLIAFNVAGNGYLHLMTTKDTAGDTWTALDARRFCEEMVTAGRNWMASRANDRAAVLRLAALVDVRLNVPPLSRGIPMICAAIEK
jgi:hypothetical protein